MGNRPFSEKRVLLRDSSIIMNREISLFDEWDVAQIRGKRRRLVQMFLQNMAIPYGILNAIVSTRYDLPLLTVFRNSC